MLSELGLALTPCRSEALLHDGPAPEFLANIQKVLHHSAHFIKIFDPEDCPEVKEVASRAREVNAALQQATAVCLP